jgi:hypothetical protein
LIEEGSLGKRATEIVQSDTVDKEGQLFPCRTIRILQSEEWGGGRDK